MSSWWTNMTKRLRDKALTSRPGEDARKVLDANRDDYNKRPVLVRVGDGDPVVNNVTASGSIAGADPVPEGMRRTEVGSLEYIDPTKNVQSVEGKNTPTATMVTNTIPQSPNVEGVDSPDFQYTKGKLPYDPYAPADPSSLKADTPEITTKTEKQYQSALDIMSQGLTGKGTAGTQAAILGGREALATATRGRQAQAGALAAKEGAFGQGTANQYGEAVRSEALGQLAGQEVKFAQMKSDEQQAYVDKVVAAERGEKGEAIALERVRLQETGVNLSIEQLNKHYGHLGGSLRETIASRIQQGEQFTLTRLDKIDQFAKTLDLTKTQWDQKFGLESSQAYIGNLLELSVNNPVLADKLQNYMLKGSTGAVGEFTDEEKAEMQKLADDARLKEGKMDNIYDLVLANLQKNLTGETGFTFGEGATYGENTLGSESGSPSASGTIAGDGADGNTTGSTYSSVFTSEGFDSTNPETISNIQGTSEFQQLVSGFNARTGRNMTTVEKGEIATHIANTRESDGSTGKFTVNAESQAAELALREKYGITTPVGRVLRSDAMYNNTNLWDMNGTQWEEFTENKEALKQAIDMGFIDNVKDGGSLEDWGTPGDISKYQFDEGKRYRKYYWTSVSDKRKSSDNTTEAVGEGNGSIILVNGSPVRLVSADQHFWDRQNTDERGSVIKGIDLETGAEVTVVDFDGPTSFFHKDYTPDKFMDGVGEVEDDYL